MPAYSVRVKVSFEVVREFFAEDETYAEESAERFGQAVLVPRDACEIDVAAFCVEEVSHG